MNTVIREELGRLLLQIKAVKDQRDIQSKEYAELEKLATQAKNRQEETYKQWNAFDKEYNRLIKELNIHELIDQLTVDLKSENKSESKESDNRFKLIEVEK